MNGAKNTIFPEHPVENIRNKRNNLFKGWGRGTPNEWGGSRENWEIEARESSVEGRGVWRA